MKSRAAGGAVYVAASKPSKWLTMAPSVVALVATVGAGFLTYTATIRASDDRTADSNSQFLRQQQQLSYSAFAAAADTAIADMQKSASTAVSSGSARVAAAQVNNSNVDAMQKALLALQLVAPNITAEAASKYYSALVSWVADVELYQEYVVESPEDAAGIASISKTTDPAYDLLQVNAKRFLDLARSDVRSP